VTSHSFRKTVATLIDDAGLSARIGADHLGHAKVSMTQHRYMSRGRVHTQVADLLDRTVTNINDDRRPRRVQKHPLTCAPGRNRTCDLGTRRPYPTRIAEDGHVCQYASYMPITKQVRGSRDTVRRDTSGHNESRFCCNMKRPAVLCSSMAWVQKLPSGRWRGSLR
jgi:hypothetical protein